MIDVQLKAKHFYLIADNLFSVVASDSFTTLASIKTACSGSADEDLVTVLIDPSKVVYVYNILTYKPEGQYNKINSEMDDLLTAQVATGSLAGNTEWIDLGNTIASIKANNLTVVSGSIESGKAKLYN